MAYVPSLRVRLNWGYHDGAHTAQMNWEDWSDNPNTRKWPLYIWAHKEGMRAQRIGAYTGNSQLAYLKYLLMNGVSFKDPALFIKVDLYMRMGN